MRELFRNAVVLSLVAGILMTMGTPKWRKPFKKYVSKARYAIVHIDDHVRDVYAEIRKPIEGK